jgi:hypothetical protein
MALIACPECTAQVSDVAQQCPRCAFPIASLVRCDDCGTRYQQTVPACPTCGRPSVVRSTRPNEPSPPGSSPGPTVGATAPIYSLGQDEVREDVARIGGAVFAPSRVTSLRITEGHRSAGARKGAMALAVLIVILVVLGALVSKVLVDSTSEKNLAEARASHEGAARNAPLMTDDELRTHMQMGEEIAREEEDVARVKEKGRTAMLISFGCAGLLALIGLGLWSHGSAMQYRLHGSIDGGVESVLHASGNRGHVEGLRNALVSARSGRP